MSIEISDTKVHVLIVKVGDGVDGVELLYSYDTVVAFRLRNERWSVCENMWGITTGRHIMDVTGVGPADRIPHVAFGEMMDVIQRRIWFNPDGDARTEIEGISEAWHEFS